MNKHPDIKVWRSFEIYYYVLFPNAKVLGYAEVCINCVGGG
jgi:hypothetical protein